ncbi:MAG: Mgr1-like, i-AAA protease complex subunit [Marinobacter excellens HL-55]|uniref:Mgr1-like, i-AAA protease complex subunit n=1 Tax=Marinobacter excellens HL-55 TaxID=1305731 RepID=A0A0P7ZM81_9GAMM|nr:MAG: Mgr1-like, i-AAA protease complex subunit [Marinobacter excellens HL-55]
MDPTTIVLLLAAIVTVSLIIVVISQMREKARIERVRKMTAQEDLYNRAYRLLSEIPGQYLTPDLKLLLLKRMEDACNELIMLKSGQPVSAWLESVKKTKKQVTDSTDSRPAVKIDSPEKATYIKELLQHLFKMIETMHKSGRIDTATAKKNLKHVLFLVHKTHADLHVFQARDHIRQNQIRKAIHAYHLASTELGKSKDNPLAMKAVKSFRTRIKELEASIVDGNTDIEGHGNLDREWDNFLQDDGSWKKKADYDD